MATEADRYRKDNRFYRELRWSLGDGLLNSQDERWKRQRRFIQPLFTRRRIAGYAAAMGEEAEALAPRWRAAIAAGEPIDLHAEMSRVTLRIVGRLLFGADVERAVPVVAYAFPVLGEFSAGARVQPGPPPALVAAPVAPARPPGAGGDPRRVRRADRRAPRRRRGRGRPDEPAGRRARRTARRSSDAEIRDQVLIFMLAGHDTTAIALTFALHLLGQHPEAQARVRAEAAEVLRRPHAGRRRRRAARLHDDGPQGGDAPLSARVGLRPPRDRRRRGRGLRGPARGGRDREPVGDPPASRRSGPSRSASIRSASRRTPRPRATATRTSPSGRGRAPASASTSRCSRRRSCSP